MAKIFVALEELSVTDVNDTLEQSVLEQEFSTQDLNEEVQQSKEAIETSEVLEKMNNASSSDEASVIATEYLLSKIGYSKKYSLESFNSDLQVTLSVAQEGFFFLLASVMHLVVFLQLINHSISDYRSPSLS